MGALIKLSMASRILNYMRTDLYPSIHSKNTRTACGIELSGVPKVTILGGERDGEILDNNIVNANQRVKISLGTANPNKYNLIMEPTPELLESGSVQMARFLEPEDNIEVAIYFKADKKVNINNLKYLVRLYMID